MKSLDQKQIDAKAFSNRWKDRGDERQDCHPFWIDLLENVLGVSKAAELLSYETPLPAIKGGKKYLDIYIKSAQLLIEQKSHTVDDLDDAAQQALNYYSLMNATMPCRYIIVSNFKSFRIYDHNANPAEPVAVINLEDLSDQIYQFEFIVDPTTNVLPREAQISNNAGKLIRNVYDSLAKHGVSEHELNMFCTRLMFCFFAEDAGLFPKKKQFTEYLKSQGLGAVPDAINDVFETINTRDEDRPRRLRASLNKFPYVNGGLFAANGAELVPDCDAEAFDILLNKEYECFNWKAISPAIFGAIFESTLKAAARKENGMHYTSVENIHKVIDPLFLNDLKAELEAIQTGKMSEFKRTKALADFQNKLASLTFLDPACGSGNFLTETYICLRRLENKVIKALYNTDQSFLGDSVTPIKVSINQFYGIEIDDFAATVAKTALWIAEFQMRKETEEIIRLTDEYLPLHTAAHIAVGNSLRMNWQEVVPNVPYIIGNPPFVGTRSEGRKPEHKADLQYVFGKKWKGCGGLDYVCGWFKKAFDYMEQSTNTRSAFVATKAIIKGMSPSVLWEPTKTKNIQRDFAWKPFRWSNDAVNEANVDCVIIGFSASEDVQTKYIFSGNACQEVPYINAYLDTLDVSPVPQRSKPLSIETPKMVSGIKLTDDGHFLFTNEEKAAFLAKEPAAAEYFKVWYDSEGILNNTPQWCLWLCDCSPEQLDTMPHCQSVVNQVEQYRKDSANKGTQKLADSASRYDHGAVCFGSVLAVPQTSSGVRSYIPMAFLQNALYGNMVQIVPNATVFDFGILTSKLHLEWVKYTGSYRGSSVRYLIRTVYNTFPWPTVSKAQQETIEKTAQAILDARANHPTMTLAQMYKKLERLPDLKEAHEANDRAVLKAYGLPTDADKAIIMERLNALYTQYVQSN